LGHVPLPEIGAKKNLQQKGFEQSDAPNASFAPPLEKGAGGI
jgi:hypothetical protein